MIQEARKIINEVDKEMAALFQKRMEAVREIAKEKIARSLPIEDKLREQEVIERNREYISDKEISGYYTDFLQKTIDISKNYQLNIQSGVRVAYCGVEGAFAHIAAMKIFKGARYVAYPSFESAYQAVIDSECDTCVLPIENSFAGDVGNVMDLVFSGPLFISQIYDMNVSQSLLAKKGTKKEDIERVLSHPQALNQCSDYIERHHFQAIEYTNTAASAMAVHNSSDMNLGCIASEMAAELYDLEVIESNINSSNSNTTRFAVFSKVLSMPEKERKMGESFILVFTVANEAGALAKTLNIIGAHGFNMRNLRSRPMKSLIWNYYFFLELEGNINSADGEDMMHELKPLCDRLKLAGTYSTAKEV